MKYCQTCLTPETRPRVVFDEAGVCNACLWNEKIKTFDWNNRMEMLGAICDTERNNHGEWDVIIPCSGGKDGSYVAWKMKHELDMHPLCITFAPQIQTYLGRQNLDTFKAAGFDHILISPDAKKYREIAKTGFVEQGRPKLPFVTGISTAIIQMADRFQIPFIMYGEQGEEIYGGDPKYDNQQCITKSFLIDIYYSGHDPSKYGTWWELSDLVDTNRIFATHWSKFEDWDPEHHAKFVNDKIGLQMLVGGSIGTFTNYSQLDDVMQDLHAYMMFVKFGFGRATSDASIEIRRGRMTRQEGVNVVNKLDGQFPLEYLPAYLSYFDMTKKEFWETVEKFRNKDVLKRHDDITRPYILREPCA